MWGLTLPFLPTLWAGKGKIGIQIGIQIIVKAQTKATFVFYFIERLSLKPLISDILSEIFVRV